MNKIISITFVATAIFSSVNAVFTRCSGPMPASRFKMCGSDGKTYRNQAYFDCAQISEYGKRINLQYVHFGYCYIWEEYGFQTTTIIFVSSFRIDFIPANKKCCCYNIKFSGYIGLGFYWCLLLVHLSSQAMPLEEIWQHDNRIKMYWFTKEVFI